MTHYTSFCFQPVIVAYIYYYPSCAAFSWRLGYVLTLLLFLSKGNDRQVSIRYVPKPQSQYRGSLRCVPENVRQQVRSSGPSVNNWDDTTSCSTYFCTKPQNKPSLMVRSHRIQCGATSCSVLRYVAAKTTQNALRQRNATHPVWMDL